MCCVHRFLSNGKKYFGIGLLVSVITVTSSCSFGLFGKSKSKEEAVQLEPTERVGEPTRIQRIATPTPTEQSNIALKQAQIWNRMNELEDDLRVQREKVKLLEQGLLTGIVPSELSKESGERIPSTKQTSSSEMPKNSIAGHETVLPDIHGMPTALSADNSKDAVETTPDSYKVRVQVAKDYFQGSRFGMAVAELAALLKEFGQKAGEGEAKLLIGRSYLGLKEFSIARNEIESFLTLFPNHPQEALARLELARAYYGLNLRDRSRSELAKVAKNFQGSEEAEIANNEIAKMKGVL